MVNMYVVEEPGTSRRVCDIFAQVISTLANQNSSHRYTLVDTPASPTHARDPSVKSPTTSSYE